MITCHRIYCFFALFCSVYFLESIGGFYMTSAVQSIERQFQIPSRLSGMMVSAGDFGYIPAVVFVSYMGSKGNRARWIGGGCLLIALANFLISSSNFVFPASRPRLASEIIAEPLMLNNSRLMESIDAVDFIRILPDSLVDRYQFTIDKNVTNKVHISSTQTLSDFVVQFIDNCTIDNSQKDYEPSVNSEEICFILADYLTEQRQPSDNRIYDLGNRTIAPFAICDSVVNHLRIQMHKLKCSMAPTNTGPFILIFTGLLCLGVGRTVPWSLGLPLVDDNVKRKNLPIYFAGMFFIRILGPILGMVIGSICNRLYYTLETPVGLNPRDPTWIGAWWVGFLGIAIVLFLPSLGLFFFPNSDPNKHRQSAPDDKITNGHHNHDEMTTPLNQLPKPDNSRRGLALVDRHALKDKDGNTLVPKGFVDKAKDFSHSMLDILKTPIYTGAMIGRIIDVMAFKGFFVFLPKYLENQFGIPQYKIMQYMALVGISGFAIGVMIGSVIMRRWRLDGRKAAAFVAICSAFAAILCFANSVVGCESALTVVGKNGRQNGFNFTTTCNRECSCDNVPIFPVCDSDGQHVFYSPCHAGCTNSSVFDVGSYNTIFDGCTCAGGNLTASRDYCPQKKCENKILIYFVFMAISGIFGGMGVIPGILIILRSVPPIHRSISLGFNGFLVSLLATLPSPIIWGLVVDSTCVLWEETCGGIGSCLIYEARTMRLRMHILYGGLRLISLATDIWVYYFAKDLKLMEDDDEKEENDDKNEITNVNDDDKRKAITDRKLSEAALKATSLTDVTSGQISG